MTDNIAAELAGLCPDAQIEPEREARRYRLAWPPAAHTPRGASITIGVDVAQRLVREASSWNPLEGYAAVFDVLAEINDGRAIEGLAADH
jgi:hypothetical protein